jgi:5-hydroxyisourate hydrolase-like protein (transthyretin family)
MLAAIMISNLFFATWTFAADIKGQVLGAGAPITQSTVTLLAASAGQPKQLAQTKTDKDGRFA